MQACFIHSGFTWNFIWASVSSIYLFAGQKIFAILVQSPLPFRYIFQVCAGKNTRFVKHCYHHHASKQLCSIHLTLHHIVKTYTQPSSFVTKDDINSFYNHYSDVVMGAIAFQITIITIAYSTVYTVSKKISTVRVTAFVMGIYGWPVTSPHKGQ